MVDGDGFPAQPARVEQLMELLGISTPSDQLLFHLERGSQSKPLVRVWEFKPTRKKWVTAAVPMACTWITALLGYLVLS